MKAKVIATKEQLMKMGIADFEIIEDGVELEILDHQQNQFALTHVNEFGTEMVYVISSNFVIIVPQPSVKIDETDDDLAEIIED